MSALSQQLGWLLLNTVWQLAALWAGLRLGLLLLLRHTAQTRYLICCGFLLVASAWPVVAFVQLKRELRQPIPAAAETALVSSSGIASQPALSLLSKATAAQLASRLRPILAWLVLAWAAGCAWQGLRLFRGWRAARRLLDGPRQNPSRSITEHCLIRAKRFGLKRPIEVAISPLVDVPSVVGTFNPVLLLPVGAFLGFSSRQIDGILDHELAHIRRFDPVVNLLQCITEVLGFYHPAVLAINRCIRAEREHACDEAAISGGATALEYAQALAQLEETRQSRWVLAAVSPGALTPRIHRLLGMPASHPARSTSLGWCAVLTAGLLLSALTQSAAIGQLMLPSWSTSSPPHPSFAGVPADYRAQINARLLMAHQNYGEIFTEFDPPAALRFLNDHGDASDRHYSGVRVRWQPADRSVPETASLFLYEDGRPRGQVRADDVILQPALP